MTSSERTFPPDLATEFQNTILTFSMLLMIEARFFERDSFPSVVGTRIVDLDSAFLR